MAVITSSSGSIRSAARGGCFTTSPQFDPIWRERAQGLPGFVEPVARNREREFRIDAVRADGEPVVCEVLTNVIHGLSRLALGLPSITPALIARCYDEPSGLFRPAVQPAIKERIPLTWTALAPLALPDLPEEVGHRLVGYLLDERRFLTAVAPPSVSLGPIDRAKHSRLLAWRVGKPPLGSRV